MTEVERNKEVLRDLLAAVDRGDIDAALTFYSPDYVDHDPSEVRSAGTSALLGLERAFRSFWAAFRDTRHSLDDLIGEGDRVAARISVEAVQTGEILGIPPSGRTIRNDSLVIYRFENGRIAERWCLERRSTREVLELARQEGSVAAVDARPSVVPH